MKSISILLTVVALLLIGCTKTSEQATTQTAAIKVETAVCEDCAETIVNTLKKVDGVEGASVAIGTKTATVQFLLAKVDLKKIEQAIADAGYDANDTKRNPEAYDKLADCCKIDSKSSEEHH